MLIQQKALFTFRVVEWPKSQASHNMFFTVDKLRYNLVPLIDYLSEKLFKVDKAFVYRTTFTLVNAVSPVSNITYGYAPPPPRKLYGLSPLTLTFAFTSRDTYIAHKYPGYSVSPYTGTTIWGNTLRGSTDFLTINIPKSVFRACGITTMSLREMKWIYMVVGAFSKGFVQRSDYYNPNGEFLYPESDIQTDKSVYLYKGMQYCFKQLEYAYWGYTKEMWDSAPNMIHPDTATPHFCEYFCLYLRQYYGKYNTDNIKSIETKVEDFVRSGVIDLVSDLSPHLSLPNPTRNYEVIKMMLKDKFYTLADASDIEATVRKILNGTFGR